MAFLKGIEEKGARDETMGVQQVTMVEQRTEGWKHSGTVPRDKRGRSVGVCAFFTDVLPAVEARRAPELLNDCTHCVSIFSSCSQSDLLTSTR